ncbi:tetratricopeptide repeat protein [Candidatus Methylomirabilis limnetica]|uniref:tetratricopeptide repeat protein n=1 Tax=Candidatus Methylomirabilis limnetica TaxID=2033718 RepID=UPI00137A918A|nr:tetratricopeptide repeat protein [Candidatus Methylomirabilis limnetica]
MGKWTGLKPPSAEGWLGRQSIALLILLVAVGVVYSNSFDNEFLFDDLETIVELHRPGSGPFQQLEALLGGRSAYRPVRSASYAMDYAISGLDPWGYHLTNTALHGLSAICVYLIARTLFASPLPALLAALLFAVHPIQTESVTYLSGRRDVLSGLFVLIGFYSFLRYRQSRRVRDLVLTILLCPLAFFTKESGIILPLLCLGYDVVSRIKRSGPDGEVSGIRAIWSAASTAVREGRWFYLPAGVLTGALAFYVLFLVRGTSQRAWHGGSLEMTLLTMARVFLRYLALLLFPMTLNADYSYNAFSITTSWADPTAWLAVAIWGGLGVAWYRLLLQRPPVAFGGLWFLIALLPVSQIIPHHDLMAEHFLYVPSVGFALLVAGLLEPVLSRPRPSAAIATACILVLSLLAVRTVVRNADWKDELTLWSKTVQTAPESARARNNLGAAYLRRGQFNQAEEQLAAAVAIQPDLTVARGNLGKLLMDRGDLVRAEEELEKALAGRSRETIPRLWLGAVYLKQGKATEAEAQFQQALTHPRSAAYAHNNLGVLLANRDQPAEAEAAFREALRLMPDLLEAKDNLRRLSTRQEISVLKNRDRK